VLIGRGWAFIHIPKCGGTAIRSYLPGSEVGALMPLGKSCAIFSPLHRMPARRPARRIFTVVRHPADWIRSYWLNPSTQDRYLQRYWSDDLDEFVWRLCSGRPGYVGALYQAHIAWPYIKVFRLEDGLEQALAWVGVHVPRMQAVNKSVPGPQLSAKSRRLIAASEVGAISRFGY